jgi:hypothetical protein
LGLKRTDYVHGLLLLLLLLLYGRSVDAKVRIQKIDFLRDLDGDDVGRECCGRISLKTTTGFFRFEL